jgi:hypothetical protein
MCLKQSTLFSDATATIIVKDEFAILPLLSFLCLLMGVEHSILLLLLLLLLLDDDRIPIGGRMMILMLIIGSIDIVVAVAGSTIRVW